MIDSKVIENYELATRLLLEAKADGGELNHRKFAMACCTVRAIIEHARVSKDAGVTFARERTIDGIEAIEREADGLEE